MRRKFLIKYLFIFMLCLVGLSMVGCDFSTQPDNGPRYEVVFKDYDGSILQTIQVTEGKTAVYTGKEVKREGYVFVGWSESLTNVKNDLIVFAVYEVETDNNKTPTEENKTKYTVTFKNYDGSILQVVTVEEGKTAIYTNSTPIKPNNGYKYYSFNGWDVSLENVTANITVNAIFTEVDKTPTYKVTFKNYDGTLLAEVDVKHGEAAIYPKEDPTKANDGFMGYAFKGWDKSLENITSNITVTAQFEEFDTREEVSVTFKNYNGIVLYQAIIKQGGSVTYAGPIPTRANDGFTSYEFSGWDKELENITESIEVTAQFTEIDETPSYTVVFKNHDGSILEEIEVRHGEAAVYSKSNPKKESNGNIVYTFAGWDKELENVVSDLEIYALFDETVTADLSYRVNRDFSGDKLPTNLTNEDKLPLIDQSLGQSVSKNNDVYYMISGTMKLCFYKNGENYSIKLVDGQNGQTMFINNNPVVVKMEKSATHESGYSLIETTQYGVRATVGITTSNGSLMEVVDCYYFPVENEIGVFNVRRTVKVETLNSSDTGFASEYVFAGEDRNKEVEWYVPNNVFKTPKQATRLYRETYLGIPMMMFRDKESGYTLSLSRYQPVISGINHSCASLTYDNNFKTIKVSYPVNGEYHSALEGAQHVYDLSIRASHTEDYEEASYETYNAHFNLQNQRIVNTDIDEVYNVINNDFKTFLHKTEQVQISTGNKYYSYGLPWRITIEDGEFGPLTYQAGFVGQQIPAAYNMILYGIMNNDLLSLQNGINTIDFWVEGAELMSGTVVPRIWYDTTGGPNGEGLFRSYPTFLRMAVDAMEGLMDAYLILSEHGIEMDSWYSALEKFGNFLTIYQNEDGSYYRCYNLEGGPFKDGDNGIEEPNKDRNICQSESKVNTPMAVRILGKYYELTGQEKFKTAALKAGEFIYNELYPRGNYQGGTCDNSNAIDKEAGVYAMYAYDTLYMLTKDSKWIKCLKQATAFTMSTVLTTSFSVNKVKMYKDTPSGTVLEETDDLKAAYPVRHGYTDGLSFITCGYNGVDNYISFIYYELFRLYILTGEKTYLKQAEFIQQNTKSTMNWDDTLGYKYKSLVAEASLMCDFTYSSADNGVWLPWSSVANAEPIAKMYANFGNADVIVVNEMYSLDELQEQLFNTIGIGGQYHKVFDSTILNQVE